MAVAERATETEQAVGRLVGALCAITARDDDAESAMLASWISQVCLALWLSLSASRPGLSAPQSLPLTLAQPLHTCLKRGPN